MDVIMHTHDDAGTQIRMVGWTLASVLSRHQHKMPEHETGELWAAVETLLLLGTDMTMRRNDA